jgi:hypothetical protein
MIVFQSKSVLLFFGGGNYQLSDIEAALYESVTHYVQTEMGKADQLDGSRKGSVGFALTALQRRLASSPEAIFQSLKRRKERLERRLREERIGIRGQHILAETLVDVPEDDDDLNAEERVAHCDPSVLCLWTAWRCKNARLTPMDATGSFSGGKIAAAPTAIGFASEYGRLGVCKS